MLLVHLYNSLNTLRQGLELCVGFRGRPVDGLDEEDTLVSHLITSSYGWKVEGW